MTDLEQVIDKYGIGPVLMGLISKAKKEMSEEKNPILHAFRSCRLTVLKHCYAMCREISD